MPRIADSFALAALLVIGTAEASASPLITLSNLELGGELDLEAPDSSATEDASTTPAGLTGLTNLGSAIDNAVLDTAPAGRTLELTEDDQSALAYPLTGSISFGIAYEFEDAEEMAANVIESGMIHDDHLNHSLVVQTIWRFGTPD